MTSTRIAIAVLGLLAIILALWLRHMPGDAGVPLQGSSIDGGCAAASSPYLPADRTLSASRISFCEGGDAALGTITLVLPAHALERNDLVVAGYVDGKDVALTLASDATGSSQAVTQRAAEHWERVDAALPEQWHEGPIRVTLVDAGNGFSQWAGVGLRTPPVLATSTFQLLLVAGAILLLIAPVTRRQGMGLQTVVPVNWKAPPQAYIQVGKCLILFALTLLALAWRRPDQFIAPYIWVEDGTVSLPQYLAHGWGSLFDPVAGYLIVPSKLIHLTAMSLSASHYPELANWLNVCFHAGVLCAIALSPTTLRAPMLCAVATLLIPTDAEVFATSHYAFWWGSLLLIPPLLWRADADSRLLPRALMVVLGGLSSPMTIVLLPLFALRLVILKRTRNNAIISALAAACAATQLYFLTRSHTHGTGLPDHVDIVMATEKFLGRFIYGIAGTPEEITLLLGSLLAATVIAACWSGRRKLGFTHLVLVAALGVSILVSIMRAPLDIIDPLTAGPRYFFYPFIFLSWLIIQLITLSPRHIAVLLSLLVTMALLQTAAFEPRVHKHLDWRSNLAQCASQQQNFEMPVHYDGSDTLWHVELTPAQCAALSRQGVFH